MLQSAIVAIVVVASFVYAAWQYLPQRLRSRVAGFLLRRTPAPGLAPLASCLQAAQAKGAGCGGCGGCGNEASASKAIGTQALQFQAPPKRL